MITYVNKDKDIIYKCLSFGFLGLFIFQILGIVYINLFQNGSHLGIDASPIYTNAIEIWEQRTIYPEVRRNFSNLHLDTAMPFAALLYGMTGNIFLSYGIVNITVSFLIIVFFVSLLKDATNSKDKMIYIIPLCILFSSFGYPNYHIYNLLEDFYSLLYTSAAFYGIRILVGFMAIKTFYVFYNAKKITAGNIVLAASTTILLFICALSSGIYIFITFVAPLAIFLAYKYIFDHISFKDLIKNQSLYLMLLWVCVTFAGRYVCLYVFGFAPADTPVLTGAIDFFVNLQNIYLGFLSLFSAITIGSFVRVVSTAGIVLLSNLFIIHLLFAAVIVISKRLLKKEYEPSDITLMIFAVIITNLLIFTLSYTRYGTPVFEVRYLLPIAVLLIVALGVFVSFFISGTIKSGKSGQKVFKTVLICLLATLVISNYFSFSYYTKNTIDDQKVLTAHLSSYDEKVVYVPDLVIFGNLRVLDIEKIYHYAVFNEGSFEGISHGAVGGYMFYLKAGEYRGGTLLLLDEHRYEALPEFIKSRYIYQEHSGFGDWNIYKAAGNYLNPSIADYISLQLDNEHVVILSVRDCGSYFMYEEIQSGLYSFGLRESLIGARHKSYLAVFDGFDVVFEELSDARIDHTMEINYFLFELSSAGSFVGDLSKVEIDFEEYSLSRRGINVVVFNKVTGELVDSASFNLLDPFGIMTR